MAKGTRRGRAGKQTVKTAEGQSSSAEHKKRSRAGTEAARRERISLFGRFVNKKTWRTEGGRF